MSDEREVQDENSMRKEAFARTMVCVGYDPVKAIRTLDGDSSLSADKARRRAGHLMAQSDVRHHIKNLMIHSGLGFHEIISKHKDLLNATKSVYHNGVHVADEADNATQFKAVKLGYELLADVSGPASGPDSSDTTRDISFDVDTQADLEKLRREMSRLSTQLGVIDIEATKPEEIHEAEIRTDEGHGIDKFTREGEGD